MIRSSRIAKPFNKALSCRLLARTEQPSRHRTNRFIPRALRMRDDPVWITDKGGLAERSPTDLTHPVLSQGDEAAAIVDDFPAQVQVLTAGQGVFHTGHAAPMGAGPDRFGEEARDETD